ncbi:MAG: hypothetical protein KDD43_16650, partial [Bdellovibrionales bacterium]|nr:hypothetical protein [Bdellovibrionales bacterium]
MVTRSAFSLLISFLISISAAAGTDVLLFVQGGMGSDGASLQPYPNKNSVKLAEEIYRALKVTPAADGS